MDLYFIQANKLDKFIYDNLQPSDLFLRQVRRAIDFICAFLRENCFADNRGCRVLKVVKGGSSAKGTALKGGSDADLVLFLNIFSSYEDQKEGRKSVIEEIQRQLENCKAQGWINDVRFETSNWENPRVLSFCLCALNYREYIEFDVLPAFDALGHYNGTPPDPQVYINLIGSSDGCGGQFSTCFTELQRDFIINRPTKLKSLIRLVKHWYKQLPPTKSLPPKYALELLTVYAWEQGSGECDFNTARGFRTVLWLIQQYKELCIFWTKNYDFQNATLKQYLQGQLRKARPIILDPADPTGIVGEGDRWDILAKYATECASMLCCTDVYGNKIEPWHVSVTEPRATRFCDPEKEELKVMMLAREAKGVMADSIKPQVPWVDDSWRCSIL